MIIVAATWFICRHVSNSTGGLGSATSGSPKAISNVNFMLKIPLHKQLKRQIGQCSPICRLASHTMLPLIDTNSGEHMQYSSTYLALEEMIRKNWVTDDISEFNQVLEHYEQEGRITDKEHRALIELYLHHASSHDWPPP